MLSINIHLLLMDGIADGRIKCTMPGRTIIAYKIPRTLLEKCKDIVLLKQYGVYFMFGENEVYVGQAKDSLRRVNGIHNWDEWSEVIIFVASGDVLGPTDVCYLENRFYRLARDAKRYTVMNENEPSPGNTTEEKESELEDFVEQARLLIGVLGHNCLEPYVRRRTVFPEEVAKDTKEEEKVIDESKILCCTRKNHVTGFVCEGKCLQTNEGYVVLKGSIISPSANNLSKKLTEMREEANIDGNRVLQSDVLFKSPSAAAEFVIGNSANGWAEWKDNNGRTLREIMNGETGGKVEKNEESDAPNEEADMDVLPLLFCTRKNHVTGFISEGKCLQTNEGYVVLKGSIISPSANNLSQKMKEMREEANIDENRVLQSDVLFKSPSAAAEFVIGNSSNGWTEWKDKNRRTLKEIMFGESGK